MRTALAAAVLCTLCLASPARAQTPGDTVLQSIDWTRLQGRVAFTTPASPLRTEFPSGDAASAKVGSISLMGDYYLRPSLNQLTLTGLRATSGLMFGQRSPLWGLSASSLSAVNLDRRGAGFDSYNYTDHGTTPYLGVGYTGGGASRTSSWGFSADVGVMSLAPGNVKGLGKQNLDDIVRDLRLSPVVQFGFNYSF